jgi:pimeloyl-ACP methyl ester carboxylesterase
METTQSVDGTMIAFQRSGQGPPLILVVGAFSDRSATAALAPLLAQHFTVYEYDRRGRGGSGDTPPYSVDREIEDLEAVLDVAGGSGCVFGHSSGAVLALEAASRGVPITKLAVYEPPYMVDDTRPRPAADLTARVRAAISSGRRGDAAKLFVLEAVALPPELVEAMQGSPSWQGMEALAHTLLYDLAIVGDGSIPAARLAAIDVPTLALDGGASPDWVGHALAALAAVIPGAKRMTLDGQGHAVLRQPASLAPVLTEFFT